MEAKKWIEQRTDARAIWLFTWVEIDGKTELVHTTKLTTPDLMGLNLPEDNVKAKKQHYAFYFALDLETARSFFPRILRTDRLEGFEPTLDLRKRDGQIEQRWVSTSGAVEWRRIPDEDEINEI